MKARHTYHIGYQLGGVWDLERGIDVVASSRSEAYDLAAYAAIPEREGTMAYAVWVESVTYQNGNYRRFNTSAGNAY